LPEFTEAMPFEDLAEGSISAVDLNGEHVLLSKIGGEVFAVAGTCTHEEADLALGFVMEDEVTCPLHLSRFALRDGSVKNPPATTPLRTFPVEIRGNKIFVLV
jgi:3-phenylpropionate/trans-cinnamate dioxygenase ferredoxin component